MRRKSNLRIFLILFMLIILNFLTGCTIQKTDKSEAVTDVNIQAMAQNDYAGCYYRISYILQKVTDVMSLLMEHNEKVQSRNPTDYWDENDFHYIEFNPMYEKDLEPFALLNEQENFENIQAYILNELNKKEYLQPSVIKVDNHHYQIKYNDYFVNELTYEEQFGTKTLTCRYDPTYNRLQVVSEIKYYSGEHVEDFIYEFAALGNDSYAIQTDTERMFVTLDDDYNVRSFCYGQLKRPDGELIEKAEEKTDADIYQQIFGYELGEKTEERIVQEWKNTLEKDSIFHNLKACDNDWVTEKKNLKTVIYMNEDRINVSSINDFTNENVEFFIELETLFYDKTEDHTSESAICKD